MGQAFRFDGEIDALGCEERDRRIARGLADADVSDQ
jgi:hypothetical protein